MLLLYLNSLLVGAVPVYRRCFNSMNVVAFILVVTHGRRSNPGLLSRHGDKMEKKRRYIMVWRYMMVNYSTRKESPNNVLFGRTGDREDWKAMIADDCNRPGTCWW